MFTIDKEQVYITKKEGKAIVTKPVGPLQKDNLIFDESLGEYVINPEFVHAEIPTMEPIKTLEQKLDDLTTQVKALKTLLEAK